MPEKYDAVRACLVEAVVALRKLDLSEEQWSVVDDAISVVRRVVRLNESANV